MSPRKKSLTPFEGCEVTRTSIALTNAGDGLSQAMLTEAHEFAVGDDAYLVIKASCTKVMFRPIDKDDPLGTFERVHTFKAGVATLGEEKDVRDMLAAQAERNLKRQEKEAGVKRLPGIDEGPNAKRARLWLNSTNVKKTDLVDLCAKHGIEHAKAATAPQLIELLIDNADLIKDDLGDG